MSSESEPTSGRVLTPCPLCGTPCERIDGDLFERVGPKPRGLILHADRHTGQQTREAGDV